jgi:hypothetical protein
MLLVRDVPGTSAVDGVPSIAITPAAGIVRIGDGDWVFYSNCLRQYKAKIKCPIYDVTAVADTLLLLASLLLLVVRDVPVTAVAGISSVGKNTPAAAAAMYLLPLMLLLLMILLPFASCRVLVAVAVLFAVAGFPALDGFHTAVGVLLLLGFQSVPPSLMFKFFLMLLSILLLTMFLLLSTNHAGS